MSDESRVGRKERQGRTWPGTRGCGLYQLGDQSVQGMGGCLPISPERSKLSCSQNPAIIARDFVWPDPGVPSQSLCVLERAKMAYVACYCS